MSKTETGFILLTLAALAIAIIMGISALQAALAPLFRALGM